MQRYTPTTLAELIYALTQDNVICVINQTFILVDEISGNPITIHIGSGVTIRFEGGIIQNGTLFGNQVGIPTSLEVMGPNYVFENVTLDGWWQGCCSDLYFKYDAFRQNSAGHDSFYPIMLNLLAFENVELHRPCYFFDWPNAQTYRAINEGDHPFHLDGHNTTFYIAKNKGSASTYSWGKVRDYSSLIGFGYGRREVIIKNLTIIDNNDISPYSDYGEENCDQPEEISQGQVIPGTEQINYYIFQGLAARTEFSNIHYDGGGCFHGSSNNTRYLESLVYSNCDLFSKGFVLEVANNTLSEHSVGLDRILIDYCTLHSHANKYVGPLSFVGDAGVEQMVIRNTKICGYRGNSEFFGVKTLAVDNCILVNQGPSSEMTNGMPVLVKYTDCHFIITEGSANIAYSAAGRNLYFSRCIFQLSHRMVFSGADRLFLLNNSIIVPSSGTDYIFVVNDSVKIGYYHNNSVACPRLYEGHVSLRLDNPYVMAQYSPFQVAFCDDPKKIYCFTFNPWSDLQGTGELPNEATEANDDYITTDADGYARTANESATVSCPTPKNDTVSVTLIGKMFSEDGVHQIASFVILNPAAEIAMRLIGITIEQSYGWMYLVSVRGTPLAYVSASAFNGFQEDVRLDITITAVNGVLEVFVFVNRQLFAKARYENSNGIITSGNLTFTPNPSVGIKQIRYVPGGFIADEPDEFIDESVLN